jgi:hypothetical protein
MAEFWEANKALNVCPACDGQRPSNLGGKNLADMDHYLFKAGYPFLAIRWSNLLPTCLECNERVKHDEDLVEWSNGQTLLDTFIPYSRPACDALKVVVSRNNSGEFQISLIDADGTRSKRVANLNRVYQLEERWRDRENDVRGRLTDVLRFSGRGRRRRSEPLDEAHLREDIEDWSQNQTLKIGVMPFQMLHVSYLSYAAENHDELVELLKEYVSST